MSLRDSLYYAGFFNCCSTVYNMYIVIFYFVWGVGGGGREKGLGERSFLVVTQF